MKHLCTKTTHNAAIPCFLVLLFSIVSSAAATEFPYRAKHPTVQPISTEDLFKDYSAGTVEIVDVRSKIEYDVIHPEGAVLIPVSNRDFENDLKKLVANNPDKHIAFYCNGVTCLKSYIAAEKAMAAGLKNVFAYDAGVPDWVGKYPEKTLLLGKPVEDPTKQLIPESEFQKKVLSIEDFRAKAGGNDALVIDVRDGVQNSGALPGLEKARTIPLDKFIPNFIEKKLQQDKVLLIFDQVGKQVQWLEYYLVEHGYRNYFFLKGGATAVLEVQEYK